jgi:diketogulonate reductase-like aldo/keto reductase
LTNFLLIQVALRWVHEQGVTFVARSFNRDWMRQNMGIFDWELSDDDREMILQIPQRRACQWPEKYDDLMSPNEPYKSLEELWDGEI